MSCVKSSGVTFHNRPQAGGSGLLPRREYQLEVFASVDDSKNRGYIALL